MFAYRSGLTWKGIQPFAKKSRQPGPQDPETIPPYGWALFITTGGMQ